MPLTAPTVTAAAINPSLTVESAFSRPERFAGIVTGVALVTVNAILTQTNYSRLLTGRALRRNAAPGDRPSPAWLGVAAATLGAAIDETRRRVN